MADQVQLERLQVSSTESNRCIAWNWWRADNYTILIDLSRANLIGADLTSANFIAADLHDAHLSGADLHDANLSSTDLSGAHLRCADLSRADLSGAHLSRADLSGAHLRRAHFTGAHLIGADFSEMRISSTTLGDVDLRQVIGLTTVKHEGPSTIGTDTFYKSRGEIPDNFLRGCGLPDEMIGFVHSIAGAIQYYSAFIGYNYHDDAFATRLYNDLQANNVRCWKYTEDVKIGDVIERTVDQAIRLHDRLLVIFSEDAVHSDWVAGEVETALNREKRTGQQVLFPVTIDAAVKEMHLGWAAAIWRTRNIGDFVAWKDQDQYQPKFDRLLRDLKQTSSVQESRSTINVLSHLK